MDNEVLGDEIGQTRAVLAETVEADRLRAMVDQPLRRLGRAVGRAQVVVGEVAPHPLGPVGAHQHNIAAPQIAGALGHRLGGDRLARPELAQVEHQRLATEAIERHVGGGLAVFQHMQREVDM